MSFSLAKGFSENALTPSRALATGLFVSGVLIVAMWTYGSLSRWLARDPTVAPACFGAKQANGAPRVEMPKQLKSRADNALWNNPRGGDSRIERMAAANYVCTAKSCDRKAWEQYRSALFWYLAERLHRTRRLVDVYGDRGLDRARLLFGGAADLRIEQDLRERYNAGVFRISDFRQNQDAVSILLLAGGQALRPCRATLAKP